MSRTRIDLREEDGVALVAALLAVIILAGLAAVFVARSVSESRATSRDQRYEAAVHVAESGVDDVIGQLNNNFTLLTRTDGGTGSGSPPAPAGFWNPAADKDGTPTSTSPVHNYTLATNASEGEQYAWAVATARTSCVLSPTPTGTGQYCGIRPHKNGVALNVLYGVGFTPDVTNPTSIRVVKVGIAEGQHSPTKAIVSNGAIDPFNITICGERRDVHSNSRIRVEGGADTVTTAADLSNNSEPCDEVGAGDVTVTGNCSTESNHWQASGNAKITSWTPCAKMDDSGIVTHNESVVHVNARNVYKDHAGPNRNNWYDLCRDSTNLTNPWVVRRPNTDASGNLVLSSGQPQPCTGPIIWRQGVDPTPHFNGWRVTTDPDRSLNQGGTFRCQNCWQGGGGRDLQDGIYYVHENNALVSGSIDSTGAGAKVSIIAQSPGAISPRPQTGGSCAQNGSLNGSVGIFGVGGGSIQPYAGGASGPGVFDLLFLSDRDVVMEGNISSKMHGVIASHEQLGLAGQPKVEGAAIAEDACNSTGSPITRNYVTGSFRLTHSKTLLTPFPAVTHITAWNELKPN